MFFSNYLHFPFNLLHCVLLGRIENLFVNLLDAILQLSKIRILKYLLLVDEQRIESGIALKSYLKKRYIYMKNNFAGQM